MTIEHDDTLDSDASNHEHDGGSGDDLRSALSSAFEEHGVEVENDSVNRGPGEARERDETGRFKPRSTEQTQQTPAAKTGVTPGSTANAAPATAQPATSVPNGVEPPPHWVPHKDAWSKIDPAAQAIIAAREADVHRLITTNDEDKSLGKQMRATLTPYMATIQALGATPTQAVQSLLNADHILRNGNTGQKTQLMRQLAQQFGVDLSGVVAGAPKPDAQVLALQRQVQELVQERQQQMQHYQEHTRSTMLSEIESFRADKPDFETVRPMMAVLMQNGQALTLQDAYSMARRAHPQTSAQWLAEEQARNASTVAGAAKERTQRARSAAVSVTGAPGANSNPNAAAPDSLRDALVQNFRDIGGYRV